MKASEFLKEQLENGVNLNNNAHIINMLNDFAEIHVSGLSEKIIDCVCLKDVERYNGSMGDENGKLFSTTQEIDYDSIREATENYKKDESLY